MASLPRREGWRGVISHREEGQTLPCIYKTHPSDEKHLYPLRSNDEHYIVAIANNMSMSNLTLLGASKFEQCQDFVNHAL